MPLFDLVFTGELIEGCDPAQVRRDLERLFKADAAAISRLFTGKPVIIRKAVDRQTAMRYRAALQQAGALCRIQPAAATTAGVTPAGARPALTGELANAAILPPGSILTEYRQPAAPEFDLSGISVAPPGATLVEQDRKSFTPPAAGAFEVAPPGVVLVEPIPVTPAKIPDISALTMAPPGTEVLSPEECDRPHPPPPDPRNQKPADK
jgi:hypothetical protein